MNNIMEIESISTQPVIDYDAKAVELTRSIATLRIADQPTYETAVNYRKAIKTMEKIVEEERKKIVSPLNQAKDAIQTLFNPILMRLDNSRRHVEGLIDAYETAQERKRKEEEEKLRKAAEAEESRQRKIKEDQERAWREKEAAAKAEQERLEREIAKSKNAAKAAELEAQLEKAKAEEAKAARIAEERAAQAAEIQVVAPVIASSVQKVAGTSSQERWQAECVDLMALVKAIAEGKAPIGWVTVNQAAINKQAVATKDSLKFPGIKFVSKRIQVDR